MHTIQVVLISAHPLWLQACGLMLEGISREIRVGAVVADEGLSDALKRTLAEHPDVVIVCLDLQFGGLNFARALQLDGYKGGIMALCSRYAPPKLDQLCISGVQSVVSSAGSLEELELALYSLVDGCPEPLVQQYLRVAGNLARQDRKELLSAREKEILTLVAEDLSDQEISIRLGISARTVSNYLRYIYAKLGVHGRTGAVVRAIIKGLIIIEHSRSENIIPE